MNRVAHTNDARLDDASPNTEGERLARDVSSAVRRERGERVEVRHASRRIERGDRAATDVPSRHHDGRPNVNAAADPGVLRVRFHPRNTEEHAKTARIYR